MDTPRLALTPPAIAYSLGQPARNCVEGVNKLLTRLARAQHPFFPCPGVVVSLRAGTGGLSALHNTLQKIWTGWSKAFIGNGKKKGNNRRSFGLSMKSQDVSDNYDNNSDDDEMERGRRSLYWKTCYRFGLDTRTLVMIAFALGKQDNNSLLIIRRALSPFGGALELERKQEVLLLKAIISAAKEVGIQNTDPALEEAAQTWGWWGMMKVATERGGEIGERERERKSRR